MNPGLTNAHTHLELSGFAHLCPPPEGAPFVEWIAALIAENRSHANGAGGVYRAAVEAGIEALRRAGTTTVGDISATSASVEPLLESGLTGVVYLEALGLVREAALQRLDQVRAAIDGYCRRPGATDMQVGLSLHAPYSCHPDLLRAGAAWCRAEDVPLCVHVAESPAEVELFMHGRGDFLEVQRRLSIPNIPQVPACSPVAYLEDLGVLEARPLLVHCVHVDDRDVERIARAGASVVHCPRSNARLRCGRMPLEKFLAAGVPVTLGTDSLGSSPSLDVREEAEAAVALHADKVAPEVIRGLLNGMAFHPAR